MEESQKNSIVLLAQLHARVYEAICHGAVLTHHHVANVESWLKDALLDKPISDIGLEPYWSEHLQCVTVRDLVHLPPEKIESARRMRELKTILGTIGLAPEFDPRLISVDVLECTVRAYNVMVSKLKVTTLGELSSRSWRDLQNTKNCGRKTIREIEELLAEFGLALAEPYPKKKIT